MKVKFCSSSSSRSGQQEAFEKLTNQLRPTIATRLDTVLDILVQDTLNVASEKKLLIYACRRSEQDKDGAPGIV